MNLFSIGGDNEDSEPYIELQQSNLKRHYDFLDSIIVAALSVDRRFVSTDIIKALNFHAIVGLHDTAGQFRPCDVTVGEYQPCPPYEVRHQMDDCINQINRAWESTELFDLAAFALLRVNQIHPFVNGNGRTARAVCYFVMCLKVGGILPLPGDLAIPELLYRNRDEYIDALREGDAGDTTHLTNLLRRLLVEQIRPSS